MADHSDRPTDDWGAVVARWTFISTLVFSVLCIATVLIFILPH